LFVGTSFFSFLLPQQSWRVGWLHRVWELDGCLPLLGSWKHGVFGGNRGEKALILAKEEVLRLQLFGRETWCGVSDRVVAFLPHHIQIENYEIGMIIYSNYYERTSKQFRMD
jgi:hypothetical protein